MAFALPQIMSFAWSGRGFAAGLAFAWGSGCSASTSGSSTSTGGSNEAGAETLSAGGNESGTAGRGAGGVSMTTAGASAGGGQAAGAAGALPTGSCRKVADCAVLTGPTVFGTQCLSPDQPLPPRGCGAPGWCGQCNCPTQPQAPTGTNSACQTNAECPAPSAGVKVASICSQNQCTECASDSDCPESAPVCGSVGGPFATLFRTCTACRSDEQCASSTPHCQTEFGLARCEACVSDQGCAQGLCVGGSCVAGCDAAHPCADAFSACAASQRCEARTCASDAECTMPNAACNSGHCQRRPCSADTECSAGGRCVNGRCYEALGQCYTAMAVP